MSNDFTRIYQFLAKQGDWVSKADSGEKDGVIVKSEFRTFMEENFEWDGETTADGKNDLINSFWKTIDTDTRMAQKCVKNNDISTKNALDEKEIDKMNMRIEMYEILNEFTDGLSCPSVVSSSKQWKKDVTAELSALVETFISQGGKAEYLAAYLDEQSTAIENKVTAEYCAAEYLDEVMPDINKQYGYAFGSDEDLNTLINNYVQNLPEGVSPEEMQAKISQIIDSYLATAGLGPNGLEIGENTNAALNQLQKDVATTTLKSNLEAIKDDANYEAYKEMFNTAISNFIEETVNNAKAGDFEKILKYGVEEFKTSDSYKEIATTMEIKNVMIFNDNTSALYQAIEQELGSKVAEILTEGVYFDGYSAIIDEALEKANKGDFITAEGKLDQQALIEWVVKEVKENLSTILGQSGRTDELTNDELYKLYTDAADYADTLKSTDSKKALTLHKEAAISYCEALAERGEKHKALLEDVFGTSNYKSVINSCKTPSEIQDYIDEIKASVGNIKETVEVKVRDKSEEIINDINSSLTYNGTNITTARSSLTFRVTTTGWITFVGNNYNASGGVWDDAPDWSLDNLFNQDLRAKVQEAYKDEIAELNLTQNEKDNLFETALFMTLSDTTVVPSMYDEVNIGLVIEEVVKNYSQMLTKISTDENARNYIKTMDNKSIFNGATSVAGNRSDAAGDETQYYQDFNKWFKTLDKYYSNDSTSSSDYNGDDWIKIDKTKTETYTYGSSSGNIILLASEDAGDNEPVNKAMNAMLTDYISNYQDILTPSKIIELFKEAQQTAFTKLEAVKDQYSASGSSIYGYGESRQAENSPTENTDTYRVEGDLYSASTLLLNILYEMERLISKEVLSL